MKLLFVSFFIIQILIPNIGRAETFYTKIINQKSQEIKETVAQVNSIMGMPEITIKETNRHDLINAQIKNNLTASNDFNKKK